MGVARIAIGVAFALAPSRLTTPGTGDDTNELMVRSFAVREVVVGVGALLATRSVGDARQLRFWAGLGALVDLGDLATALAGGGPARRLPAALAATGLGAESWAFAAAKP